MNLQAYLTLAGLLWLAYVTWKNHSLKRENKAFKFAIEHQARAMELKHLKEKEGVSNEEFTEALDSYNALLLKHKSVLAQLGLVARERSEPDPDGSAGSDGDAGRM